MNITIPLISILASIVSGMGSLYFENISETNRERVLNILATCLRVFMWIAVVVFVFTASVEIYHGIIYGDTELLSKTSLLSSIVFLITTIFSAGNVAACGPPGHPQRWAKYLFGSLFLFVTSIVGLVVGVFA